MKKADFLKTWDNLSHSGKLHTSLFIDIATICKDCPRRDKMMQLLKQHGDRMRSDGAQQGIAEKKTVYRWVRQAIL